MRLFAALREMAGAPRLEVEGVQTVGDVVRTLAERFGPKFEEVALAGTCVVDGERAAFDRRLEGTEEVALLPPVSGGR